MKINKKVYFALIAVVIIIAGIVYVNSNSNQVENIQIDENLAADTSTKESSTVEANIFIHVCGEVNNPGVYELKAGSRVFEAVTAAGGLTANANDGSINLAEILSDGKQLYIPSVNESENENFTGNADDGLININKATAEELTKLPGVGLQRATSIVAFREENGGFSSIEDIMNVSGIKEASFEKIKAYIKV